MAICVMDKSTGYCKGCYRDLAEIGQWALMTAEERHQLIAILADRRQALGADDIDATRRRLRAERRQNRRRGQSQGGSDNQN